VKLLFTDDHDLSRGGWPGAVLVKFYVKVFDRGFLCYEAILTNGLRKETQKKQAPYRILLDMSIKRHCGGWEIRSRRPSGSGWIGWMA
jgi:hypothetical protein